METKGAEARLGFIVGHYKSGSSWLAHVLSLHPAVRGVRETHVFRYTSDFSIEEAASKLFASSAWGEGGWQRYIRHRVAELTRVPRSTLGLAVGMATLPPADVPTTRHELGILEQRALYRQLVAAADGDAFCHTFFRFLIGALRPSGMLVEKTPTNIFHLDRIRALFPEAKLVSIHRDGRDVVVSDKFHVKRAYKREDAFETRVQRWVDAMEAELRFVAGGDLHQLSYEELSSRPQATLSALLDYLELDYDESLVKRMLEGASFEALSGRRPGQEDSGQFYRKGIAGDWPNHFSSDELETFSKLAGDLLVRLGYETSSNWQQWSGAAVQDGGS